MSSTLWEDCFVRSQVHYPFEMLGSSMLWAQVVLSLVKPIILLRCLGHQCCGQAVLFVVKSVILEMLGSSTLWAGWFFSSQVHYHFEMLGSSMLWAGTAGTGIIYECGITVGLSLERNPWPCPPGHPHHSRHCHLVAVGLLGLVYGRLSLTTYDHGCQATRKVSTGPVVCPVTTSEHWGTYFGAEW